MGGSAHAEKSGVRPNVISLPGGPGTMSGLGEQFEPTLNTGSATYRVALDVPPGTAGFSPSLALRYDSGQGNGTVGIGWSLDVGSVQRHDRLTAFPATTPATGSPGTDRSWWRWAAACTA